MKKNARRDNSDDVKGGDVKRKKRRKTREDDSLLRMFGCLESALVESSRSEEEVQPSEDVSNNGDGTNCIQNVLRSVFGLHTFRPSQEEAINALIHGRDVFVLMPTGGGKSLIYQLAAVCKSGVTVVVSPLVALMKDQVDALATKGVPCAYMGGGKSPKENQQVASRLEQGSANKLKVLYVTPEFLCTKNPVLDYTYRRGGLDLFAIDECHCISSWGHSFRRSFRKMKLREKYPGVPIVALTATATARVREDVIDCLRLKHPLEIVQSFDRPNIHYSVVYKDALNMSITKHICQTVKKIGGCGIVYARTRQETENFADQLNNLGLRCAAYHAGLPTKRREETQQQWIDDEVHVMVATTAFGMGIDKADVRFVIHTNLSQSMEGYYQESGRAGRDGERAIVVLYYSEEDRDRVLFFNGNEATEADCQRKNDLFEPIYLFCEVIKCRRRAILEYFGDHSLGEVGNPPKKNCCDVCDDRKKVLKSWTDAQEVQTHRTLGETFESNSADGCDKDSDDDRSDDDTKTRFHNDFRLASQMVNEHDLSTSAGRNNLFAKLEKIENKHRDEDDESNNNTWRNHLEGVGKRTFKRRVKTCVDAQLRQRCASKLTTEWKKHFPEESDTKTAQWENSLYSCHQGNKADYMDSVRKLLRTLTETGSVDACDTHVRNTTSATITPPPSSSTKSARKKTLGCRRRAVTPSASAGESSPAVTSTPSSLRSPPSTESNAKALPSPPKPAKGFKFFFQ